MPTRTDIAGISSAAPVAAALPIAALGEPGQESLRRLTALDAERRGRPSGVRPPNVETGSVGSHDVTGGTARLPR